MYPVQGTENALAFKKSKTKSETGEKSRLHSDQSFINRKDFKFMKGF